MTGLLCGQTSSQDAKPLWVRFQTPVNSKDSAPGSVVEAVAVQSYYGAADRSIPMGSQLTGKVLAVPSKQRSTVLLQFESVRIDGRELPLKAHVVDVDNARERVQSDGKIIGLDPLRKRPGKIELLLLTAAYAHPASLALIETTKLSLRKFERPEVHYPAGTGVALAIDEWPAVEPSARSEDVDALAPPPLAQLLDSLPDRTQAKHPPKPSDWINVAFVASRQSLDQAFRAAGWQTAEQLSLRADVRVFFAVAEHHAFRQAPVSTLFISGREPDLVYQKQTIRSPSAITSGSGPRTKCGKDSRSGSLPLRMTSGSIFPVRPRPSRIAWTQVDLERAKVIRDLRFANRLRTVSFVVRASVPRDSQNATGDHIRTDGKLAVLSLLA